MKKLITGLLVGFVGISAIGSHTMAQGRDDIRWKTEEQVRAILGEPNSTTAPVGTHASYVMWRYDDFTVAFANNRAFHLFSKDSLKKISIDENRP